MGIIRYDGESQPPVNTEQHDTGTDDNDQG